MHIRVRAKTGAKNESLKRVSDTLFDIAVREKPQENRANDRIVELLARELGVSATRVRIVRGHHRPSKLLEVLGSEKTL